MIRTLDTLIAWAERISLALALAGGAMLVITVLLIMIEIVLRKVFTTALGLGFELSGYALAVSTSWALAYALFRKAHIRIDAAYVRFGRSPRLVLDLLALILFVAFALLFVDATWEVASDSLSRGSLSNTPLQTPLWIPQFLWAAGFVWFAVALALLIARVIAAAVLADFPAVQRLAGSPTLDEQLEEEKLPLEATKP